MFHRPNFLNHISRAIISGGSAVWGTITGTLSAQTDLQTALNNKSPLNHDHDASDIISGTLPLVRGGTGSSLADPGLDRILFWDESANAVTWLSIGANLSISDTTLDASGGSGGAGTVISVDQSLVGDNTETLSGGPVTVSGTLVRTAVDAGSDKLIFWDDSAGVKTYLSIGSGLSITDTTLNAASGSGGTVTSVDQQLLNDDTETLSGGPISGSGILTRTAVDAGSDKLIFWDDSDSKKTYLSLGTNLSITGTTLNASGGGSTITEFLFTADPDTGFNNPSANLIEVMTAGISRFLFSASAATLSGGNATSVSANGVPVILQGGTGGTNAGTFGGSISLLGGSGSNSHGGNVTITGGLGASPSSARNGGDVSVTGGSGVFNGSGGNLTLAGGAGSVSNLGGTVSISAGAPGGTSNVGGSNVTITASNAVGTATTGGAVVITSGSASANGGGGAVNINTGIGSNGGNVNITCGNSVNAGTGGSFNVTSGVGNSAGSGGAILLVAGTGGTAGSGGNVTIRGGSSGSSGTSGGTTLIQGGTGLTGGPVNILAGTSSNGVGSSLALTASAGVGTNRAGGSVNITPGAATGTGQPGYVNLQASGIELGTTAIGGFTLLPTVNGIPTGTPSFIPTGVAPIVIDRSNNNVYIYTNAAWRLIGSSSGNIQLIENQLILLDAVLSADGKYSGTSIAGTLGEAMSFGHVMYLKSDSKWWKAKADSLTTSGSLKLGMCLVAGAADAVTNVLLNGNIRADAVFPTMTPGSAMYVSNINAGEIISVAPVTPDHITRAVGWADDANTLYFMPANYHLVHL